MSSPAFKEKINKRVGRAKEGQPVPTDFVRLENGNSSIEVRKRGAFITECKLETFTTDPQLIDVLYCGQDTSTAKLPASHLMSPVGPSEEIGGQHGLPRWVDWHVFEPTKDILQGWPTIVMQAKRDDEEETILRALSLDKHNLKIRSTLQSNSERDTKVSLGEHLYFPCSERDIPNIAMYISGESDREDKLLTLEEAFGKEMVQKLMQGEAFFWPDFSGYTEINFGNNKYVQLRSRLSIGPDGAPSQMISMIIWHLPGSDSICFEPVVGFWKNPDGTIRNDELRLAPSSTIELETSIEA